MAGEDWRRVMAFTAALRANLPVGDHKNVNAIAIESGTAS
jgi:hypothetical protein